MGKTRIQSEITKIQAKIDRNRSKGYNTDNLNRALNSLIESANKKDIKIKLYA